MPRAVESVVVKAPMDTVWELLIDKAENPQRYLEGILDFRILGRGEGWILREMELTGAQWLRERVDLDPAEGRMTFRLEDHPAFEGTVVNRVSPHSPGAVTLTFEMDWVPKQGGGTVAGNPAELIHGALGRTKEIAEELVKAAEQP